MVRAKAYLLTKPCKAEEMKITEIELGEPGPEEVLVRHSYLGISYDDVQVRNGLYQIQNFPLAPGGEAVGYVEKKGEKVENVKIGERVSYMLPSVGAYTTHRNIHQDYLVKIEEKYSDKLIAAVFRKGTVAHYLTRRTFNLTKGHKILVYGATGAVGSLLCQLAKFYGAQVIGVVGRQEKIEFAKRFGCEYVICSENGENIAENVMKITNNAGVNVVYDSVGDKYLNYSLDSLAEFGLIVNYGDCGVQEEIKNFDLSRLSKKSAFLTRPRISDYEKNKYEMLLSSHEILAGVEKKIILPMLSEYKFEDIPKLHKLMEERKTVGSLVVKIS